MAQCPMPALLQFPDSTLQYGFQSFLVSREFNQNVLACPHSSDFLAGSSPAPAHSCHASLHITSEMQF